MFVKPTGLTKEQRAYIPACLAIAYCPLQRVASGGENQSLVIHDANSGPGPAAVALAKTLGYRVFCTISDTCQGRQKPFFLSWVLKVWFIKGSLASMLIFFTASTEISSRHLGFEKQ